MDYCVKGLELDVHLSADGRVMVIHDPTLDRTTNTSGWIGSLSSSQIRKASIHGLPLKKSRIPFLEEVLEMASGKTTLYIELKKGRTYYPRFEEKVLKVIGRFQARKWCVLHSFQERILHRLALADNEIPLLLNRNLFPNLVMDPASYLSRPVFKHPNLKGFNQNFKLLRPRLVTFLQKKGFKVLGWTARSHKDFKEMSILGLDGLISDFPFDQDKIQGNNAI